MTSSSLHTGQFTTAVPFASRCLRETGKQPFVRRRGKTGFDPGWFACDAGPCRMPTLGRLALFVLCAFLPVTSLLAQQAPMLPPFERAKGVVERHFENMHGHEPNDLISKTMACTATNGLRSFLRSDASAPARS